jgi:hypothetical protein
MKLTFEILGILLLVLAATSGVMYLIQRKREQAAQKDGVVVYATLVSMAPVTGIGKYTDMRKIVLRLQEPEGQPREVTVRSRVEKGQKFTPGAMLLMVIDPKNPERIYPATAESAKRAVFTGSRQERRMYQSQMRSPRKLPQRPTGYQPPVSKLR